MKLGVPVRPVSLGVIEGGLGWEVGLLLGELVVDVAGDEVVGAGEKASGDHEHDDDDAGAAGEDVEHFA